MVTQRLLIVTAGVLMVLSAACSASAPARHAAEAAAGRASPVVMHRQPVAASGEITLAFAGDVHFAGRVARLLEDPATTFGPITSVLKSADFTNLETPVTRRGQPQPKTYHFATTPGAFTALRDAGVDLVTIANNHIPDYGQTGLADTLAAAKAAHFPFVGAGVNAAAAWAPYVTTINGTSRSAASARRCPRTSCSCTAGSTNGDCCSSTRSRPTGWDNPAPDSKRATGCSRSGGYHRHIASRPRRTVPTASGPLAKRWPATQQPRAVAPAHLHIGDVRGVVQGRTP